MGLRPAAFTFVVLSLVFALPANAQQASTVPAQNLTAISLARNSVAVLSGGVQISDITLTGTATRVVGSDTGSGTVTLNALGTTSSRIDLSLSDGTFSELRTSPSGPPEGRWLAPSGSYNSTATHNCFTDAAWFFPALTVLSQTSNPDLSISYVGQQTKNGISVQHLQFALSSGTQIPGSGDLLSTLSSTDVYLDSSSLLPVAMAFNTHPDNNALVNIPVEIDFSNYQAVKGVQVPFHIQKFLNGSLFLDMTIQSANVNSGLTVSAFSAN
jgi:hypothetical protein